jgi:hypothetical protein
MPTLKKTSLPSELLGATPCPCPRRLSPECAKADDARTAARQKVFQWPETAAVIASRRAFEDARNATINLPGGTHPGGVFRPHLQDLYSAVESALRAMNARKNDPEWAEVLKSEATVIATVRMDMAATFGPTFRWKDWDDWVQAGGSDLEGVPVTKSRNPSHIVVRGERTPLRNIKELATALAEHWQLPSRKVTDPFPRGGSVTAWTEESQPDGGDFNYIVTISSGWRQ